MEVAKKKNPTIDGARELDAGSLADLFALETLAPPGEANGGSCCVIICWVKYVTETSTP